MLEQAVVTLESRRTVSLSIDYELVEASIKVCNENEPFPIDARCIGFDGRVGVENLLSSGRCK